MSECDRANLKVPFEREFQTARIRYPMCASPPPSGSSIEFKQLYKIIKFGYLTFINKIVIAKIKKNFTLQYIGKTFLKLE